MICRHDWSTASGDDLAVVVEDSGAVRLVWVDPQGDEHDCQPRDHAHALLALVADLLCEKEEVPGVPVHRE